jgi:hypothetical protein
MSEPRETPINMIDALAGQRAQLKRLLARKLWISNVSDPPAM